MYSQERREDLLESTLVVFHRANELLNCSHITPGMEEESKDWDVMRKPSNDVLESLFKQTHSDKAYQIFTPEVYELVKTEKKFSIFVGRVEPEESVLPLPLDEALNDIKFFHTPQPDLPQLKIGVLRTKTTKIEHVLQLMGLVKQRLLTNGFQRCVDMLQKVNKKSYWALQDHINTDILDKAFRAPATDKQDQSEGSDSSDSEIEDQTQDNTRASDANRLPLDPQRLNEFNLLKS